MQQIMDISQQRKIVQSQRITFETPTPHPDRTMTEHDLFYVVEGGWTVALNGERYTLQENDVVLLPAGVHHTSIDLCSPKTSTIFIHFTPLLPDFTLNEVPESAPESAVILPTVIHCGSYPNIKRMFEEISQGFWSPLSGHRKRAYSMLTMLLCELSLINEQQKSTTQIYINEVLAYMERSPQTMFTIEQLAEVAGISPKTLTTWFKKHTGMTVHRYQVDTKLSKAYYAMLNNPNTTFRDLAASLGFYDEFHFSRLFKQKYGIAPYDYKRRLKEENIPLSRR